MICGKNAGRVGEAGAERVGGRGARVTTHVPWFPFLKLEVAEL